MANITKNKIIETAVDLFNKFGVSEVSTRDIAEACGISLGNLTYHFPHKKDLMLAVVDTHQGERQNYPSAKDMDFLSFMDYLNQAEFLRTKYSFYFDNFVDLSRLYKEVYLIQKRVHTEVIAYYHSALESFHKLGLLKAEQYDGHYNDIACGLTMISSFWGHHVALTNNRPAEHAYQKKVTWSVLVPFMTEKGYQEFVDVIMPLL